MSGEVIHAILSSDLLRFVLSGEVIHAIFSSQATAGAEK